jgi:outer membrane biosynthesis protein TonB
MNYRCIAAALLLSTAALTTPTVSWAQGTSDEATTTMARARFKEGVVYYDKGQFDLARASFLQAYALKRHPAILLNLAWSCVKSGHALEGARYFKQFLTDSKDVNDKQRADVNDGLSQARAKLAQIDITAAAGLDVTIDGDHVGTTPLAEPALVEVGTHAVRVRAPDGTSDMQSVTVLTGEKASAHFRAAPPPPPPAPLPPPAPTPAVVPPPEVAAPPPPPPTTTTLQEPPKPLEPMPAEPPAEPRTTMPLWPSFVGLGLTATSVVVGVVAFSAMGTAQSNSKTQASNILGAGGSCPPVPPAPNAGSEATMEYQQLIAACSKYSDDNNLVSVDRTVGWVSLGAGAALLAGSVIYLIVAVSHNGAQSDSPPPPQALVLPLVSPSLSGLAVVGTF